VPSRVKSRRTGVNRKSTQPIVLAKQNMELKAIEKGKY
jgi:hypothetical protein